MTHLKTKIAPRQRAAHDATVITENGRALTLDELLAKAVIPKDIQDALDALPLQDRNLLILADCHNLSHKTIAVLLDLKTSTIANRLHKIRHPMPKPRVQTTAMQPRRAATVALQSLQNEFKLSGKLAAQDDPDARFNELMQGSYKKVYNVAYRMAGNRNDAEDLTQDAFYRAYRSFGDYDKDRSFDGWICRIVTRLYLDMLRNRDRRIKTISYDAPLPGGHDDNLYFDMPDSAPSPEQLFVEKGFSPVVQRAFKSLLPAHRAVVMLADVEGMSYREVSEALNITIGTVRARLHRGRELLREKIEHGQAKAAAIRCGQVCRDKFTP